MNILIVHNAYQSTQKGGEDIVVQQEVAALKSYLGHEHVYQYIVSNDKIFLLSLLLNIWGSRHHAKAIAALVKKHNISLVHVHNFFPLLTPSVFKAAHKAGAKVIHTLHNFRWWCLSGILFRANAACEKCLTKKWAWPGVRYACYRGSRLQSMMASLAFAWYRFKKNVRYIDAFFALTLFQKQKLQNLIPAEKIFVKHNFVSIASHGVLKDKENYLFVGRCETAKGFDLLMHVWQQLPTNFCLEIIGNSEKDHRLKARFEKENIRFLGILPRAKVLQKMAQSKYLVHPSLAYETFGLTLIESMAQGTPVIGLDIGTRNELIQHAQNGFLCHQSALLETIKMAQSYPKYQSLCEQAQQSAQAFEKKKVLDEQIALYDKVLGAAWAQH